MLKKNKRAPNKKKINTKRRDHLEALMQHTSHIPCCSTKTLTNHKIVQF